MGTGIGTRPHSLHILKPQTQRVRAGLRLLKNGATVLSRGAWGKQLCKQTGNEKWNPNTFVALFAHSFLIL
jgi:hypothetical protein